LAGQTTLYYQNIEKLIHNKNIKIVISPSDEKIKRLIDDSQVVVQTSTQESFGLTLIESAARKKPIVCSNIPTLKELANNLQSGLIFEDEKELIKHLKYLLAQPNTCQKLGEKGQSVVTQKYLWETLSQKLESVILNL